jgi:hypothetical protein
MLVELGLLGVIALSVQLTESPGYTEVVAPRGGLLWRALFPILSVLDSLHPHVIGPDRTREATIWFLPLLLAIVSSGYILAILAASRGRVSMRLVFGFIVVFQGTLALMPGLFSADLFSYAMYGRLAAVHGLDPYVVTPDAVPSDPLLTWVGWPQLVTPYGPLWTDISSVLASLTAGLAPAGQAYVYRLLMNGVQLANVGLLWRLSGLLHCNWHTRLSGLVLFAWNPLVLLETAGNAHNDTVMALLVLLGLLPLATLAARSYPGNQRQNRGGSIAWLLGLGFLVLGALVKYLPLFPALVWASAWIAQEHRWHRRLVRLAAAGTLVVATVAALSWPWAFGLLHGPLMRTLLAGGDGQVNSLRDASAHWVATRVLPNFVTDARAAHAIAHIAVDAFARTLFISFLLFQLAHVWNRHTSGRLDVVVLVRASAAILLAVLVLLMSQVLAWYFVTPLALASLLGVRSLLARVTVCMTLMFLPIYYLRHYALGPDELLAAYVLVPVVIPGLLYAWPRLAGLRPPNLWWSAPDQVAE